MKALGHVLFFGFLGPLFAGLAMLVSAGISSVVRHLPNDPSEAARLLLLSASAGLAIWPVAVLFGGIPAAITGVIYWALKARTNMVALGLIRTVLIMFIVGAIAAGIFAILFADTPRILLTLVLAGGVASSICSFLLRPRASA
jgi:hypothetical protein